MSLTTNGLVPFDSKWVKFLTAPGDNFDTYWAILLAEYVYLIWKKRNEVVFNKKFVTPNSLVISYKCALRERIRVDFSRLKADVFQDVWINKPLGVTIGEDRVKFAF